MNKYIKYSLITTVSIVATGVIGVTLIVTVVNPNRFKPAIETAVYQSTGRTLSLDGDISWKIYPNLGITVRQVTLSNPQGFDKPNFMKLDSADVSVALIPLLSNHIVVKTLAIDGLDLALVEKNGINNWTFTPPNSPSTATGDNGNNPQPLQLEMSKFSFTKSAISYDNFDKKQHYNLKQINLLVDTGFGGKIKFDQGQQLLELSKVTFNYNDSAIGNLDFNVANFTQPKYSGQVKLTKLQVNNLLSQFAIAKQSKLLDNVVVSGSIAGDENNVDVKDFTFNLSDQIKGKTTLAVKDLKKPRYSGNLDLEPFNLNQILDYLNIANKERKNTPLLSNFAISSSGFSGDTNNINLNNLKVSLGKSVTANFGKIAVKNFKDPQIAGSFDVPAFNLNQVLDGLGVAVTERKDKPLLNSFAIASSGFTASSTNASFNNLKVALGEFKPSFAKLTVANFKNPQVSGNVTIPNFSLNNVMQQLGMSAPKIAHKTVLDNIAVTTTFAGSSNSVNLTNLKTKIGQSNISGNLNVHSFKPLAFNNNIAIDQIDVADFSDINGYKLPIKQLQLNGNTKISSDMNLATLNGSQTIQAGNITLQGISLDKIVLQLNNIINSAGQGNTNAVAIVFNTAQATDALNKMKAQIQSYTKPGARDYSQTTNLGNFSANVTFNNGNINPSNVKLTGKSVSLTAGGSVNLAGNHAISYKATSQLLTQGINPIFQKLTFPSTVSGTYDNPSASLDWSSIQQQILHYVVEQNKGQIKNVVKQQINQAIGSQINQAIGQQNGNQATDAVSQGVTNAIGKLFGN